MSEFKREYNIRYEGMLNVSVSHFLRTGWYVWMDGGEMVDE